MAVVARRLIFLVFLISIVQGRILRLNSSDDHLISDGVEYLESSVKTNTHSDLLTTSGCSHQYGFLPCAENAAGYFILIVMYQLFLVYGEKQIGNGSKVLNDIIEAENSGGIIFRVLMALPSMTLMIASGIFSSKENAQSQVSVGVSIYAGIAVFTLTVNWGMCVMFGRRDLKFKLDENKDTSESNCLPAKEKLMILKDRGVHVDRDTRFMAGVMLLSLIPYVIVQLVNVINTSLGKRIVTLISLIVSSLSLLSYFIYQIVAPWMHRRSLDYSKYEIGRKRFLQHMEQQGQIMNEDGRLNLDAIQKLFAETNTNADKHITRAELEQLVLDIIKTRQMNINEGYAVSQVMKIYTLDSNQTITEKEFIKGCQRWIDEAKPSSEHCDLTIEVIFHKLLNLFQERNKNATQDRARLISKILKHAEIQLLNSESLITNDENLTTECIQKVFDQIDSDGDKLISPSEIEQFASSVQSEEFQMKEKYVLKELIKDFDVDDNNMIDQPKFIKGVKRWLDSASIANTQRTRTDKFDKIVSKPVHGKRVLVKSVLQVLLGIVILTFLGGPLTGNILQFSYAMRLPSFSISFIVVPIAMSIRNLRATMQAFFVVSSKTDRTASLTFSEIYGGVIMNNFLGLTTLLAIVYAKDLNWDFSAEVLTILVVCAIIGIVAYRCTTYPLWTCILAVVLYPFSLGLFYSAQVFLHWN